VICVLEKVKYSDNWKEVDVEAYTDGYAYDQYSHLYFMSVGGYEARVKAITSALVSGREIRILGENPLSLWHSFSEKYKILGSKLGIGLIHQIVLADAFFKSSDKGDKLLYVDKDEDAPEIVYNSIKRNYSVPLIPQWSQWLYEKIKQENGLEELSGTKKVIRLFVSEEELDSFISEGIKSGEIEF
jgi:predicted RecB family endonuclease